MQFSPSAGHGITGTTAPVDLSKSRGIEGLPDIQQRRLPSLSPSAVGGPRATTREDHLQGIGP